MDIKRTKMTDRLKTKEDRKIVRRSNICKISVKVSRKRHPPSRFGMVGRKKGACLGTLMGSLGLFLCLMTSICNKCCQRLLGSRLKVTKSAEICWGDLKTAEREEESSSWPPSSSSSMSWASLDEEWRREVVGRTTWGGWKPVVRGLEVDEKREWCNLVFPL